MTLPRWLAPGALAFALVWLLLLAAGRTAFFNDPGTFWHVRTGELILEQGFLREDPFTFTFAGTWWVPYQWLGEVPMALVHGAAGFDGLLLFAVSVVAAVFAWLTARFLRSGLHPIVVLSTAALALAASASHLHVRPHLFTLAATAAVFVLLAETDVARPKLKRLFWLVPLCVVWANVHGGVLGGIGTIGIAFAGWIAFWKLGRPSPVKSWRDVRVLALAGAGCALSPLVGPYGPDLPKTWFVIMGASELREIIIEHRPLDVTQPYAWPVLALAVLFLFVLWGTKRNAVRVVWLLPLVWFALSVSRCRHVSLFAVSAFVCIAAMWKHTSWALWMAARRPDFYQPGSAVSRPLWASLWLPVALVALSFSLQVARLPVPVIGSGWAKHAPENWPLDVLDVLKEHEPREGAPNKLFNSGYSDGGFVIYHAPGYRVFVDDRCEVFGGPWLKAFVEAQADPAPAFADWEQKHGPFDFALTRTGTPFDVLFRQRPGWVLVKESPTATFYRRALSR